MSDISDDHHLIIPEFSVRFWGVRGSTPAPGPHTVQYGGNTPCVEIRAGGRVILIDCGSGIRAFGRSMYMAPGNQLDLLMSHYHWDHVQGFPFFGPAYHAENKIQVYGPPVSTGGSIEDVFKNQMVPPYFPVPMDIMKAEMHFDEVKPNDQFQIGPVDILAKQLNHSDITLGYRITWKGISVAYVSDTEHIAGKLDSNVLALAEGADVLIYDAMYTDKEYLDPKAPKAGWGHSTWQEGLKIAEHANVGRFVSFHHDPIHNDRFLRQVEKEMQLQNANACVAYEGLVIGLM